MSPVSVVIPSWNGRHHLETLLPTVAADEVIVADAKSPDGTRELTEKLSAKYLELPENRGFAYGVNRAIEAAKHDTIAVLNNDLQLGAGWLETLAPHLDQYPFAVGKLYRWGQTEILDGSWDLVSLSGYPLRCGHGKRDGAFFSQRREIALAPWTAIVLRRDYWERIGPLDEEFGSFFEDVDFGLRSLAAGFRGIYEPGAVAWHRGSSTLGEWNPRQVELSARNQLILLAKHGGKEWLRHWPKEFWIGQILSAAAAWRHDQFRSWWRGKRKGWSRLQTSAANLPAGLAEKLEVAQNELFTASQQGGLDPFWRYYWALTL